MDRLSDMPDSDHSYIRTRGLTLLAYNAKWDKDYKIDEVIDKYLKHITDIKPITARQCIKLLHIIAKYRPELKNDILSALDKADLSFYDKAMISSQVTYSEKYISTSYGKPHVVIVGDSNKTPMHGRNGISPLNIRLFLPLLEQYCLIEPDVIGMPGKSEPYRNLHTNRDDFGLWFCELLDGMRINKISFAVSSYSSSILFSLAKVAPNRIDKAMLLVPSGIAHGAIAPMISILLLVLF